MGTILIFCLNLKKSKMTERSGDTSCKKPAYPSTVYHLALFMHTMGNLFYVELEERKWGEKFFDLYCFLLDKIKLNLSSENRRNLSLIVWIQGQKFFYAFQNSNKKKFLVGRWNLLTFPIHFVIPKPLNPSRVFY